MKKIIFTLASARSGTLFLRDIFAANIPHSACRHEPFFDWGNPTLFGPAIYDAYARRFDRIRVRLAKKQRYIDQLTAPLYLESSHAFLKSAYVAALDFFPEMKLVHLIRDPLLVAKSEAWRQEWRQRLRAPFHFYTGDDGRRHFCWALTGNEEIFQHFEAKRLSLFQWYLIQWIEIENRAMTFLEQHQLHARCFTLHSSRDLNDSNRIREMFAFFGLTTRSQPIRLGGRRNKSICHRTVITPEDEQECQEVLESLPKSCLEIFQAEPYLRFDWSARLRDRELATASS